MRSGPKCMPPSSASGCSRRICSRPAPLLRLRPGRRHRERMQMTTTAVIEARDLKKVYGSTPAVDSVSFDVQPGRIVGLIGPNGAGKTTVIKAILGLPPFQGELKVLGLDPDSRRNELM